MIGENDTVALDPRRSRAGHVLNAGAQKRRSLTDRLAFHAIQSLEIDLELENSTGYKVIAEGGDEEVAEPVDPEIRRDVGSAHPPAALRQQVNDGRLDLLNTVKRSVSGSHFIFVFLKAVQRLPRITPDK
jgi:hypothetical protein